MDIHPRTIASAAAAVAVILAAGCATTPPPVDRIAVARAAVADAESAGAPNYDAIDIKNARDKLDTASLALAAHDNDKARRYADEAEADANLAATRARSLKAERAVAEVRASLRALREEISSRSGS